MYNKYGFLFFNKRSIKNIKLHDKIQNYKSLNYFCSKTPNDNQSNGNYNPEKVKSMQQNLSSRVISYMPNKMQQLLFLGRYDRPIGYLLLFLPCSWGATIGTSSIFSLIYMKNIFLFFTGSVLMRSSGCIINDLWDKDIDTMVTRTKGRPIASGAISIREALAFLTFHLGLSLFVCFQLPSISIISSFLILPLVVSYPYMKRITYLPQVVLGMCFSSGVYIGYFSMIGSFGLEFISIYLSSVIWTVLYDTIYAHMDKLDDVKTNVKSTALLFGDRKEILYLFALVMLGLMLYHLNKKKVDKISSSALILAYIYQFNLIRQVNLSSPLSCLVCFKSNAYFGFLITGVLILNKLNNN